MSTTIPGEAGTTVDELHRLAHLARWLMPDRRDPERFHVERSELERGLRRLASRVERGAPPSAV